MRALLSLHRLIAGRLPLPDILIDAFAMTQDTRLYTNMITKKDQNAASLLTARRCPWLQSVSVCHSDIDSDGEGIDREIQRVGSLLVRP